MGSGVHLSPTGVDFDQRVSGAVTFRARCYLMVPAEVFLARHTILSRLTSLQVVTLARDTSVRFAGRAQFPKQVPVPEGRPLLDWEVSRLGLKTSW